jgi:hypothetical protein
MDSKLTVLLRTLVKNLMDLIQVLDPMKLSLGVKYELMQKLSR